MISDKTKQTIDALPKEELRLEVVKGNRSRFQQDNFAYAESRLKQLDEEDQIAQHKAQLKIAVDANEIAKHANALAVEANTTAKNAWRAAIFSVIVALLTIVVTMCSNS